MPNPELPEVHSHRTPDGRFARGNRAGKGNPLLRKVHRLRSAMLKAVTTEDIEKIIQTLIVQALAGDVQAAKEVLDRALGRQVPSINMTAVLEQSQTTIHATSREGMAAQAMEQLILDDPEVAALADQMQRRIALNASPADVSEPLETTLRNL